MLRREFILATAASNAFAADYRDYSRCLPDYLRRLAWEAYERRRKALAAVTSPADAARRKTWARETFWRLAGAPLEKTPLNARVTGAFERDGYRVEKLIYESRPGLHIPANLYVPRRGRPPYPGVLFQMGHARNGKASPLYQYCCQGLAQLGFLVLGFDPMGQGERVYYPKPGSNDSRLASPDHEHTVPGKQFLITGDTSTRFQLWDAVRSLDYLAAHPLVDPARLASTGNSGGGTLTMLLAAVDDRLTCAAIACPNTENLACARFNPPGSTDDAEQNFVFAGPAGFDRWDTLYPFAPKPLLVLVSARDFYGTYSPRYIENGREEFAHLLRIYKLLGRERSLVWRETALPHGLSYELRMDIYNWFRRHMQGIGEPLADEPPVNAEPDEVLQVSPGGNVVRDFGGLTPRKIALENARGGFAPAAPDQVRELLALDDPLLGFFLKAGAKSRAGVRVDAVEFQSAPEVFLPAWMFYPPEGAAARGTVIVLDPRGRTAAWGEDAEWQQLARRGYRVCAVDVRGVGDLRPEFPRNSPQHANWHQDEDSYAWASLMLGKPLLGQRVTDILAVVRSLPVQGPVTVSARGWLTLPSRLAAHLEPRIARLHLTGELKPLRRLLELEEPAYAFGNYVPGLLRLEGLHGKAELISEL